MVMTSCSHNSKQVSKEQVQGSSQQTTHISDDLQGLSLRMQSYIDSCSSLYLEAINEMESSNDARKIQEKYANKIKSLHSIITMSFDSVTTKYMDKEISQKEYDDFMHSLKMDSVEKRSDELSKLGINIELKE